MEIQLFKSPQFGEIRTAGMPDAPMFCLADICKCIGISNARNVRQRLDEGDVRQIDTPTTSGIQAVTFVTEAGMYDVVIRSDSPQAVPFRRWVTGEVLPSIRKTGAYATPAVLEKAMQDPDFAIGVFQQIKSLRQQNKALEGKNALLEQENKALAPKAEYTDEVLLSDNTYTHTQMAKELNFRSVNVFLQECQRSGILFRQSGTWMLYSKFAGKGYTKTRTAYYTKADDTVGTNTSTVWTEEGRRFLHEKFNIAPKPIDISMIQFTD